MRGDGLSPETIEAAARAAYGSWADDWLVDHDSTVRDEWGAVAEAALLAGSIVIDCPNRTWYQGPDGNDLVHPADCDACRGTGRLRVIR